MKDIKVTYSGTKDKTIDDIIKNLIESHKRTKHDDAKKTAVR